MNDFLSYMSITDEFTEKQCIVAIYDLYSAGLETIVITLRFCFLYILNHPHIQERIHTEIDNAIGRERVSGRSFMLVFCGCSSRSN